MDITKKAKEKERAPESTSSSYAGTPPSQDPGQAPVRGGRRRATVTVKGRVRLNLRRMGLDELFGKTMHDWKDGPLEAWVSPDDEIRLKAFRSNGIIDVKFEIK